MSVPVWKRKASSAQFIYEVYTLNIRLAQIVANKPQKYRANYGDEIIKSALSCLGHLQIADSIYLSKYSSEEDYKLRRSELLKARGLLTHISTASYIFLELVKRHDRASEGKPKKAQTEYTPEQLSEAEERRKKQEYEYKKKLSDQELEIGESCEKAYRLISALLEADKKIFKTYIKSED